MAAPSPQLVVVEAADVGARLDVVLARRVQGVSRSAAKALLAQGRVHLDGRRARGSDRVADGARIELRIEQPQAADQPIEVVFADASFAYVLKPAGIHTVRLRPTDPPTLADAVADRFPECRGLGGQPGEAGAVHRLDQETSGLVAFARSGDAWNEGRAAMSSTAIKLYLARSHLREHVPEHEPHRDADVARWDAQPPWHEQAPLSRPDGHGLRVCAPLGGTGPKGAHTEVRDDGQLAESRVWWLPGHRPHARDALVELVTGRRHQARVHLAHLGAPILGDTRYGPAKATETESPTEPLHLHAVGLRLSPQNPWVWAPLPLWF